MILGWHSFLSCKDLKTKNLCIDNHCGWVFIYMLLLTWPLGAPATLVGQPPYHSNLLPHSHFGQERAKSLVFWEVLRSPSACCARRSPWLAPAMSRHPPLRAQPRASGALARCALLE